MGTLLHTTLLSALPSVHFLLLLRKSRVSSRQDAQGKWSHQAPQAQPRAGSHLRGKEGGEPRQAGGRQEAVGLHQEEQAADPRQQAVLHPRREDEANLRRGEGQSLRDGQVPERASHSCLKRIFLLEFIHISSFIGILLLMIKLSQARFFHL